MFLPSSSNKFVISKVLVESNMVIEYYIISTVTDEI
jgi:hypothetical protein